MTSVKVATDDSNQDPHYLISAMKMKNIANEKNQDQEQDKNDSKDKNDSDFVKLKPRSDSFDFIRRFSFGKESSSLSFRAKKLLSKKALELEGSKKENNEYESESAKTNDTKGKKETNSPIFTKYKSNRDNRRAKRDSLDMIRRQSSDGQLFVPRAPLPFSKVKNEAYHGMI